MLKIIRRVLRFKRRFIEKNFGAALSAVFLESMFGLLPIAAVFIVLTELQAGHPITGQMWGIVVGLIAGGFASSHTFQILSLPAAKYGRL